MVRFINEMCLVYIFIFEDFIEFLYMFCCVLVSQCEIGIYVVSFVQVLWVVLCEDLDVLLVGELCDMEIICLVLIVVEIGYLVLIILYVVLVVCVVDCIIDVFVEGEKDIVCVLLVEVLQGVVVQILVLFVDGVVWVVVYEVLVVMVVVCNFICEGCSV